jgi:anti-sigma regulatory factor (Ser/Thr protein kinase)
MSTTDATGSAYKIITATFTDLHVGEPIGIGAFPARADQIARARALVHDCLTDHPARDIAVLLVSELATNAIRHSRSKFFASIITRTTANRVRITVIDEGQAGLPHLDSTAADAEDGRGMTIVDLLATCWGIIRWPGVGTAVWSECADR